jgi:flagellar protein FlaG
MEAIGAIRSQEVKGTESVASPGGAGLAQARNRATPERNKSSEESKAQAARTDKKAQEKIRHIAQAMDEYVRSTQRSLKIQVHPGTGDFMVKVISEEDGRTIREIPPEEVLNLAAKMEEMMGLIFNEKV